MQRGGFQAVGRLGAAGAPRGREAGRLAFLLACVGSLLPQTVQNRTLIQGPALVRTRLNESIEQAGHRPHRPNLGLEPQLLFDGQRADIVASGRGLLRKTEQLANFLKRKAALLRVADEPQAPKILRIVGAAAARIAALRGKQSFFR